MTLRVHAPVAGRVLGLAEVPDAVFAQGLVGPGWAIEPSGEGAVTAVAPVAGRVVKGHPHAFVLLASEGRGVLVHLGIDTVQLGGDGFTVHVAEGNPVAVGDPMITFEPGAVAAGGRSPVCPVIALDGAAEQVRRLAPAHVASGAPLFDWG
ncbi:MAG TPA: PTS glucose transporter subunit IIA [Candidatus Ruania gallistercoris]|uniref:PTS glucose transporter subunit IIA n=1 Tax=Candidatus Ruania gallistercoris TaxID=2838746 RepID=A0A9D2ECH5_9MICO|nr:PTS glucose transporter subunit IIA [Candidatus Ruania gallistercoris]